MRDGKKTKESLKHFALRNVRAINCVAIDLALLHPAV
jgi:hypothetical protein